MPDVSQKFEAFFKRSTGKPDPPYRCRARVIPLRFRPPGRRQAIESVPAEARPEGSAVLPAQVSPLDRRRGYADRSGYSRAFAEENCSGRCACNRRLRFRGRHEVCQPRTNPSLSGDSTTRSKSGIESPRRYRPLGGRGRPDLRGCFPQHRGTHLPDGGGLYIRERRATSGRPRGSQL